MPLTHYLTWLSITLATALAPMAPLGSQAAPYPQSGLIADMQFDFTRHVRRAAGSDNWPLTWGSDDHQYTSWGDGWGFDGGNTKKSLGYSRIEGAKDSWTARDTYGSEGAEAIATVTGKAYAILSVNGVLYSFISPGSLDENVTKATLYRSTDRGHSWAQTSVVFTAATHGLMLPGFLQFGRDYAGARDGYVYAYWTRIKTLAWGIQRPGEIVLTRVPVSGIENQGQYQYFAGLDGTGAPTWSSSLGASRPVFEDPEGAMISSAVYHPGLGRYLLCTVHTSWATGNLAFFEAPEPWGPWRTIRYYTQWPPGGQVARNSFYANFSSKWFGPSLADFVLVFTGIDSNDSWNSVPGTFVLGSPDTTPPSAPESLRAAP